MHEEDLLAPLDLIESIRYSFIGAEIVYLENSYGFYEIMKSVFIDVEPWLYKDHIVAKIEDGFYNITGEVEGEFEPLNDEKLNYLRKNKDAKLYNRKTNPVPADPYYSGKESPYSPDVVFLGYYYGIEHSPDYKNQRKRSDEFFGRKSGRRTKR